MTRESHPPQAGGIPSFPEHSKGGNRLKEPAVAHACFTYATKVGAFGRPASREIAFSCFGRLAKPSEHHGSVCPLLEQLAVVQGQPEWAFRQGSGDTLEGDLPPGPNGAPLPVF